jgi:hypothetical protein
MKTLSFASSSSARASFRASRTVYSLTPPAGASDAYVLDCNAKALAEGFLQTENGERAFDILATAGTRVEAVAADAASRTAGRRKLDIFFSGAERKERKDYGSSPTRSARRWPGEPKRWWVERSKVRYGLKDRED